MKGLGVTAAPVLSPAEVVAACGALHGAACEAFARSEGWASWAALAAVLAFEALGTGGGCEAWTATFAGLRGARRVLLTDPGGAGLPDGAGWILGVQDVEGEAVASWTSDVRTARPARLEGSLAAVLASLEARGVVRLEFVGGPVPGGARWAAVPPSWEDARTLWELVVATPEGDVHAGTVVTG